MYRLYMSSLLFLLALSVQANDEGTYHLLDTQGRPVFSGLPEACIDTPKTENIATRRFKQCGDVIDTDGDGVFDDEDNCPNNTETELVHGVEANGCPVDLDGDGVPDFRDRCPSNTAREISRGVNNVGCPKDNDQDGIPDFRDRCLGTPFGAKVDQYGCQEVVREIKQILGADVLFGFDKSSLIDEGKAVLTQVAANINAQLADVQTVTISGHTDSSGQEVHNQTLSERRAKTVAQFIKQQGIPSAKVQFIGYGETQAIASNATKQGRAKNRRVEISIKMTE